MGIPNEFDHDEFYGSDGHTGSRRAYFPPCPPGQQTIPPEVGKLDLGRLMPSSGHLPMLPTGANRGNAKMRAVPGGYEQRPIPKAEPHYLDKTLMKPGFHLPDVKIRPGKGSRLSPRSQTSTSALPKIEKRRHSPSPPPATYAESHTSMGKNRKLPPITKAGSKRRHIH